LRLILHPTSVFSGMRPYSYLLRYNPFNFMKFWLVLILFTPLMALVASVDWVPTFADRPVPAEQVAAITAALPAKPIVSTEDERRILVYSATQGFRHKSIPHGKLALELMGKTTEAYTCVISDHPKHFEPEALAAFDAVLLLSPTLDMFLPSEKQRDQFSEAEWAALTERQKRLTDNLVAYVQSGGGLMGIHAATDACYNHKEYGEMIGGYFGGHPWNKKCNVTIVVEDPEHETIKPVFDGVDDFRLVEEIYQFKEEPYSRENLRILLHLDPDRSDKVEGMNRKDNDYPVAWVQKVGEGRVFYTSIGHNEHIYANPLMLKHYLAGIQFAVGDLQADTTPSAQLVK
jgi:type 1 glutamine amidotransferase